MEHKAGERNSYPDCVTKERSGKAKQHTHNYERLKSITARHQRKEETSGNTVELDAASYLKIPPINKLNMSVPPEARRERILSLKMSNDASTTSKMRDTNIHAVQKVPSRFLLNPESQPTADINGLRRPSPVVLTGFERKPSSVCEECEIRKSQLESLIGTINDYKNFAKLSRAIEVDNVIEKAKKEGAHLLKYADKLKDENRKLLLKNSVLEDEKKALQKELDYCRAKLGEKTVECEEQKKKIDKECLRTHTYDHHIDELNRLLTTSNAQNRSLKTENSQLVTKNKMQGEKEQMVKETHEEEIRELKALLLCVYNSCIQEKKSLQDKYAEIGQILMVHQAYSTELDCFIKAMGQDTSAVVKDLCDKLKTVFDIGNNVSEIIKEKLRSTVNKQKELEMDLEKTLASLEKIKEEVSRHHCFITDFLERLCSIIRSPYRRSQLAATQNVELDANAASKKQIEMECNKVLSYIVTWKHNQKLKVNNLEKRISKLDNKLKKEIKKVAASQVVMQSKPGGLKRRKLMSGASRSKPVIVAPKEQNANTGLGDELDQKALVGEKGESDATVNQLLAKHIHFGKILSTVAHPTDE